MLALQTLDRHAARDTGPLEVTQRVGRDVVAQPVVAAELLVRRDPHRAERALGREPRRQAPAQRMDRWQPRAREREDPTAARARADRHHAEAHEEVEHHRDVPIGVPSA